MGSEMCIRDRYRRTADTKLVDDFEDHGITAKTQPDLTQEIMTILRLVYLHLETWPSPIRHSRQLAPLQKHHDCQ